MQTTAQTRRPEGGYAWAPIGTWTSGARLWIRRRRSTSTPAEFQRFLVIALGSIAELETHVEIARQLEYLESQAARSLLTASDEVTRMIEGLLDFLRTKGRKLKTDN